MGNFGLVKWVFWSAFFIGILSPASSSEDRKEKCEKAVVLDPVGKTTYRFGSKLPLKMKPCRWALFADEGCEVELECQIDIPEGDDCSEEYVKITDGSTAEKKYCGKQDISGIRASEGLRHLFVVLGSETSQKMEGFTCTAKCAKPGGGKRLKPNIKRRQEQRCVCGLQNKDDRIVGGEDAKKNEFPWQAAIVYPKTRSPNCGASVINDRYILTAAHCFYFEGKKPNQIEILLNAHTLDMTKKSNARDVELGEEGSIRSSGYNAAKKTDADEHAQRYKVVDIINHPFFTEQYDYDFALLKLDKKINLGEASSPTPICLPPANTFDSMMSSFKGKNMTVSGWGMADEKAGGTTRILQKLDVPWMEFSKCKEFYGDLMTRRMICLGFEQGVKDACTGDSGGPLVFKTATKQWQQFGIVSWGEGCARAAKPGVYSRVTEMMQWIHFHTQDGDPKWCKESL